MSDNYIKIVPKLWGEERWIRNDGLYCMKELLLKVGCHCSLHYHKKKTETFYVVHGRVMLEYPGAEGIGSSPRDGTLIMCDVLSLGQVVTLHPGDVHRFRALSHTAMLIECSTQHFEDDSYRLEPSGEVPSA